VPGETDSTMPNAQGGLPQTVNLLASTMVEVSRLALPQARVEISVTAQRSDLRSALNDVQGAPPSQRSLTASAA
jgi:hypothetical protein